MSDRSPALAWKRLQCLSPPSLFLPLFPHRATPEPFQIKFSERMQSLVSYSWPRYCAIFVRYPRSIYLFPRVANDLVIGSIFLLSPLPFSFFFYCLRSCGELGNIFNAINLCENGNELALTIVRITRTWSNQIHSITKKLIHVFVSNCGSIFFTRNMNVT